MRISLKRHRAAFVALAFVATGIGGYTAASATGGDHRPIDVSPNTGQVRTRSAERAAPTDGQSETYTGITPCRIIDTRSAGGPIANTTRAFKITGNLSAQGGGGNCGIPSNASSIAINLTGITTGGTGFLRASAFGSAGAGATVVNYAPGLSATNQANIPLCRKPASGPNPCTGGNAFTIQAFGTANLVADAVGYYTPPIYAYVSDTGVLGQSAGVLSAARTGLGTYEITLDRDVGDCAATATNVIWDEHSSLSAELADSKLKVTVTKADNQYRDTYFYVTVTC